MKGNHLWEKGNELMIFLKHRFIKGIAWVLIIGLMVSLWPMSSSVLQVDASENQTWVLPQGLTSDDAVSGQFIVKWKEGADAPTEFLDQVEVIHRNEDARTMLVQWTAGSVEIAGSATPNELMEAELKYWSEQPWVKYIQPNYRYKIKSKPDDPHYAKQTYLKQIDAEGAWETITEANDIIVAVVDTGIDFNHPDLKDNLLPGKNILNPDKAPIDDNGHGTNVAGILGAVGNNTKGITGLLWSSKIMPVKALDKEGIGTDYEVGEGIRYAVDNGAKVIVLSLGLPYYGPHMEELVRYAEKKGVVVVAATGNEGERINYPAAYPSVIAVGAVDKNNEYLFYSNHGPEIDVVAPGEGIYTTFLDGKYDYNSGTSMAAPQIAALATMILTLNPDYKPSQVRNLIRYSAKNIGKPGWDTQTGYGVIQLGKTLTTDPINDLYEPNDIIQNAKGIPLNSGIDAELNESDDIDMFYIDAPYAGTVNANFQAERSLGSGIDITVTPPNSSKPITHIIKDEKKLKWNVSKGRSYIRIKRNTAEQDLAPIKYVFMSGFIIYPDVFEDNDERHRAYVLAARNQTLTGTFHKDKDVDWYMLNIPQEGKLKLTVKVDSNRMDPVLWVQKVGDRQPLVIDEKGQGKEESISLTVLPGKYNFRISDFNEYAVIGEYSFSIRYETEFRDNNEPNNKSKEAAELSPSKEKWGTFDKEDVDYYKFQVKSDSLITVRIGEVPKNVWVTGLLINSKQKVLGSFTTNSKGTISYEKRLGKGTYYVKLASSQPFNKQRYYIKVQEELLVAGFRDIANHWAQNEIIEMTSNGHVKGYSDYTFRPYKPITRAEIAALLVRVVGPTEGQSQPFNDVSSKHWAHSFISKAYQAGWITGYEDGSFRPDEPVTRAEMAVLVSRAYKLKKKFFGSVRFSDVPDDHWAFADIKKLSARNWVRGYGDDTFRPHVDAARAEFVKLLYQAQR
jgi:subtilisin family serine protease